MAVHCRSGLSIQSLVGQPWAAPFLLLELASMGVQDGIMQQIPGGGWDIWLCPVVITAIWPLPASDGHGECPGCANYRAKHICRSWCLISKAGNGHLASKATPTVVPACATIVLACRCSSQVHLSETFDRSFTLLIIGG